MLCSFDMLYVVPSTSWHSPLAWKAAGWKMSESTMDPRVPAMVSCVKPLPGALIVHDQVPTRPLSKLKIAVQKSS